MAVSIKRLLQSWQKHGRLQQLLRLELLDEGPEHDYCGRRTSFSQTVITIASFCNLYHCCLQGPFSFKTAVALLPSSLVVLDLWPDFVPLVMKLSAFLRFPDLQQLDLGWDSPPVFDPETADLVLDASFGSLTHLKIGGSICCRSVPAFVMSACVPNLLTFKGMVMDNDQGTELAKMLVALPKLQVLHLNFDDGDRTVGIPGGSLMRELELRWPNSHPKLSVKLSGIQYKWYTHTQLKL